MRLIDADALMDDIKRDTKKAIDEGDKAGSFWLGYAAGLVIKQPTIKPEATDKVRFGDKDHVWIDGKQYISLLRFQEKVKEVQPKEGHWIRRDCGLDVECKCSECGYRDFVEPRDEYWFNRNFCPNCGAKMKGVTK